MLHRITFLRSLVVLVVAGCSTSAPFHASSRDERGRFLNDTLVMAAPGYGTYSGTTVPLGGYVWRRGSPVADSSAPVHWSVRDVSRGWVSENGILVLLKPGKITLVAESGTLRTQREILIQDNPVGRVELVPALTANARPADTLRFTARLTTRNGTRLPDVRVHYAIASRGMGMDPGATIDDDGRFVAQRPGIYTVVAAVGAMAARTTVIVPGAPARADSRPVRDLEIEALDDQPYAGTFAILRATGLGGNGGAAGRGGAHGAPR